jgi:hypothetical protein
MSSTPRRSHANRRPRAFYDGKILYDFRPTPVCDRPPARAPTGVRVSRWSLLPVAVRRLFGAPPLHQS